ncbi:MAG: transposase [Deltaproteobacteria bacterium]|nr:transposase [Deltaproteobacteria bacterium]
MSRPLRIEYPGAWYLVLNHGRKTAKVFDKSTDYQEFIDLLREASALWNIGITAYCLVPDHYHLLLKTPESNLSRCMRHINGIYTQRYNKRHDIDGSLFKGRFKCILLPEDHILLEMVRYIHREPVRKGLVSLVDEYQWSSHPGYLSFDKKWEWLGKEVILSMLPGKHGESVRIYQEYMNIETPNGVLSVFDKKKLPAIMGGKDFMAWARKNFFNEKFDRHVPASAILAPDVASIKKAVCLAYRVDESELMISRRGRFNEARGVAIYLTRILRKDSLDLIAAAFDMSGYSSVSSAIVRLKKQLQKDRLLPGKIEEIKAEILA